MSCHLLSSAACPEWVTNNEVDWCAPAGIKQLKECLSPQLPYEPAEHQLISTARILMGQHVMCVWATGEGKSSVFYLHALVRAGTLTIVVSPTNTLEADMVRRLEHMGITAVAVNRDALKAAAKQQPSVDLWGGVRKGAYRVILLSPEMLQTEAFSAVIKDPAVRARLAVFCADECHLIDEWGRDFRTAYGAIKDTIPWLPTWTVRVGLTATLEPGRQTSAVMEALGFTDSNSHLDRRDCERRNIDIVVRPIQYSISTNEFLDLDELVPHDIRKPADVPKTLVYCETIELGHRVAVYLRRLLPPHLQKDGTVIIRHANSLNCPKCKEEILQELYQSGENRSTAIVVTTDVLGVGMDIQDCDRVICFPTPSSVSAMIQRVGRTSRGRDRHGTAYVYIKKSDIEAVSAYLQTTPALDPRIIRPATSADKTLTGNSSHAQGVGTGTSARVTRQTSSRIKSDAFQKNMSLWCVVAAFIQDVCIVRQLNIIQGNPEIVRDCGRCSSCRPRPLPVPRSHSVPHSQPPLTTSSQPILPMNTTTAPSDSSVAASVKPPPCLRLNTADVEVLTVKIEAIALRVRGQLPYPPDALLIGAKAFLDRTWIARITENFALVTTQDILKARLQGWRHWDYYGDALWREISQLHTDVCKELMERHAASKRGKRKGEDEVDVERTEDEVRAYVLTHKLGHIKRVRLRLGLSDPLEQSVGKENLSLNDKQTNTTAGECTNVREAPYRSSPSRRSLIDRPPLSPRKPRNSRNM